MYYKYLDKNYALKYLDNDKFLFKNILEDFFNHYKNIKLSSLENNCFFKEVHQLKSFSKNIGSEKLYLLSEEINRTQKRDKEKDLEAILVSLQKEINIFLQNEKTSKTNDNFTIENKEKKKELFNNILLAAKKNRPKKVEDNLKELKNIKLEENEKELLNNLNEEIRMYNFKNIVLLIEKWKNNE